MSTYDLIVHGGRVANAPGGTQGRLDVAIVDGQIAAVEPELDPAGAREAIDAGGRLVLPGFVDPHVHVSGRFGEAIGCRMLVRAGITAALDLAGDPEDLLRTLPGQGCGLTIGVLVPVIPELTVADRDPSRAEVDALLDRALAGGALGLKALGGHFPITPDALGHVIAACAQRGAHCAVHAGSTATGSDIRGLEELVEVADGAPVQVAHINSYCRGQIEEPVAEAARAIAALSGAQGLCADSYLAIINGAIATCEDGVPTSDVVKTCLRLGGYEPTQVALEQAIADGWAQIHVEGDDGVHLAAADEGAQWFHARATRVGVSFPVNPPSAALAIALARRADRSFVVDSFGSDGGSLPRNTTLRQGLALVAAGALTLPELIEKGSTTPARMLGLAGKGRVAPGADADVIVVEDDGRCRVAVIGGRVVLDADGAVDPTGGRLLCQPVGVDAAAAAGAASVVAIADPVRR